MRSQDDYQFLRAYSPGLQEWVEALSFYHFLTTNKIISYQETQDELRFKLPANEEREGELEATVTIPQSEYVLGLADLTGELMRNAINALGAGEMEVSSTQNGPFNICLISRSASPCLRYSRLWLKVSTLTYIC